MFKKRTRAAENNKLIKSEEYALINNPAFVFPPQEIIPLAIKLKKHPDKISAVLMDMDGTTTTTEKLCIHSLEFMVRQITARMSKSEWNGLDKKDYPHIIGNSTTKHVEYLVRKSNKYIRPDAFLKSFFNAVQWTLLYGKDLKRKEEAQNILYYINCDLKKIKNITKLVPEYLKRVENNQFKLNRPFIIKAAVEIYYQRYHEILAALDKGENIPKKNLLQVPGKLIEPMPGTAIFLALIKGLLGPEAKQLSEKLLNEFDRKVPQISRYHDKSNVERKLERLSLYFLKNPLKAGLVTSSIMYEADIVMKQVFVEFRKEIKEWEISSERKKIILEKFTSYKAYYDAFITASDSNEMRLKPHRDLYSLALHKLLIPPGDFNTVVGFEDSESGILAMRAAGLGFCAAVPFAETSGHNLSAASFILKGGLPEAILNYNLFLKRNYASG